MLSERIKAQRDKRNRVRIRHFGTACGILAGIFGGLLYLTLSVRLAIPMVALTAGSVVAYTSVWLSELEDRVTKGGDSAE